MVGRTSARKWWAGFNAPLVASGVATLLCVGVYAAHLARWFALPGLDAWESATEDARARLAGERAPADDRIVIVALDDRTHRAAPEVFQNRRGMAVLIDAVAKQEPTAIGLDIFFSQPELRLAPDVVERVERALAALAGETSAAAGLAREALAAVREELRGDEVLAGSVGAAGRLHLAFLLHLGAGRPEPAPPGMERARLSEAVMTRQPAGRRPAAGEDVTISLPAIARVAAGAGFANVVPDPDGAVRRVPLVLEYGGDYYMALGLSLALAAEGQRDASYVTGDEFLELGGKRVPVDRRGRASLSYLGPNGTFAHVSAADVIAGTAGREALRGKIAIIGYTDAARDKVIQPFDRTASGAEVHATLVHNLLHGELLRRAEPGLCLLILVAVGGAIALLQVRRLRGRGSWVIGVGALGAVVACFAVSQFLFARHGVLIPVVAPVLTAALVTAAALSTGLATEGREKARLRSAFSRYVPPSVVDRILADPSRIRLGGERRELTVLFSDIRGFSSFAENLEPEVLSEYMNEFLTPMTRLILDEGGMLDKYIGDAIMAVFGAPLEVPDHALRACRSALAMMDALGPLNAEFERRGLPTVRLGIGINSGPMSVGNMGSQARFDYTVLGDAVNLGARLEALTRDYRVDVLVGEKTAELAGAAFGFRELDWVRVKGRAGVGRIHELWGTSGGMRFAPGDLTGFAAALAHYRAARWEPAEEELRRFLARQPDDGPAQVLLERIAALRGRAPSHGWDGIFDQLVK